VIRLPQSNARHLACSRIMSVYVEILVRAPIAAALAAVDLLVVAAPSAGRCLRRSISEKP